MISKNGRLGNLAVPAGAGGALPLRRVLAQQLAERFHVFADDYLGGRDAAPIRLPLDSAWRSWRGSLRLHSHAARSKPARLRADITEPSTRSNVHSGGREGGWIFYARSICREDARADDVVAYFSCAQRAWQAQVMRWSLTIPVACMNA